ncbi:hypothetical protein GGTG_01872 [Gaeumannomyces tritici R3-111a-1]|uniref:Uncharacterized protein n=1 Tax=Gaeumannomyces tritici (strain R3-111a-1) TaxID=644352 RepID=J3NKT1_GAET3|nr:hypothetical protein GGTG_01872 [Gaeumannomyces tritici R3-111a-1]EJT81898.1 hypothetical protein GGTG_01872 [Gaeumannomyces tritici R3-111a-1]
MDSMSKFERWVLPNGCLAVSTYVVDGGGALEILPKKPQAQSRPTDHDAAANTHAPTRSSEMGGTTHLTSPKKRCWADGCLHCLTLTVKGGLQVLPGAAHPIPCGGFWFPSPAQSSHALVSFFSTYLPACLTLPLPCLPPTPHNRRRANTLAAANPFAATITEPASVPSRPPLCFVPGSKKSPSLPPSPISRIGVRLVSRRKRSVVSRSARIPLSLTSRPPALLNPVTLLTHHPHPLSRCLVARGKEERQSRKEKETRGGARIGPTQAQAAISRTPVDETGIWSSPGGTDNTLCRTRDPLHMDAGGLH